MQIRIAAAVVVTLGCGGTAPPAAAAAPHGVATGDPVNHVDDDDDDVVGLSRACVRSRQLMREGCAPFDRYADAGLDPCDSVESFHLSGTYQCITRTTCDEVHACMAKVERDGALPYDGRTTACHGGDSGMPAGVSTADVAASYGRGDRTFADSPSTAAHPIEVCGIPAQLDYLTQVTCTDGSHPFADRGDAHAARAGNVGPGGRCDRIIDQYVVPCPEATYQVFVDAYRCPEAP